MARYPWRFVPQTNEQKIEVLDQMASATNMPLDRYITWAGVLQNDRAVKPGNWPEIVGLLRQPWDLPTIVTASNAIDVFSSDSESLGLGMFRANDAHSVLREPDAPDESAIPVRPGTLEWRDPHHSARRPSARLTYGTDANLPTGMVRIVLYVHASPVYQRILEPRREPRVHAGTTMELAMQQFQTAGLSLGIRTSLGFFSKADSLRIYKRIRSLIGPR